MRFLRLALVGCIAALAATAAAAQSGGITVIVVDNDGLPLPGATVTIRNELGFVKETAMMTDKDGRAEFPVLQPHSGYEVEVSFPTFSTISEKNLKVSMSRNLDVRIQMLPEIEEQVKVIADKDVIDIDVSEASTRFSEDFIADLPVPGRLYQNVLTMAPGVLDADGDGNPNVHGSRDRDFSAMVGGTRNVDPLTGQWMSRVNPNSIEEMEVITAGAGVEFGRAQGGFANIIQKQGSNTLEGVFELYMRTSKLDGGGTNNLTSLNDQEFDDFQPLMQLSGPIIKDKVWFRLSHEYRNVDIPLAVPGRLEVTNVQQWTHSDQITWQVSPRNKLAFQLDADPQRVTNEGVSAFVPAESAFKTKRSGETYKITWDAPYSPKVYVKSIFSWQDLNRGLAPNSTGNSNSCGADGAAPGWVSQAFCFDQDTGVASGSFNVFNENHSTRLSVGSTATIFGGRFLGMSHQFKLGLQIENERYFRELNQNPVVVAYSIQFQQDADPGGGGGSGPPPLLQVDVLDASLYIPQTDNVRATGTNWGLFLEDQFKPRQNLTVTMGVRLDREELNSEGKLTFGDYTPTQQRLDYEARIAAGVGISSAYWPAFIGYENFELFENQLTEILCAGEANFGQCALGVDASLDVSTARKNAELYNLRQSEDIRLSNNNFSPRASVAWSPGSNNKTSLTLTAGRQYNNIPLVIPLQELQPAQTSVEFRSGAVVTAGGDPNPNFVQQSSEWIVDVQTVSRDLRTPYADEYTFAIDRELWAETSLTLRLIKKDYRDQIQDFDINKDTGDFGRCLHQTGAPGGSNLHPWMEASPINPQLGHAGTVSQSFTQDPCPGGICPEGTLDDWLTDPFTAIRYPDTRSGVGDGWDALLRTSLPSAAGYKGFDDCVGEVERIEVTSEGGGGIEEVDFFELRRPDKVYDLYTQNPFFGDIYEIGNYNSSDYRAVVLELVRRQYRSWELNGSYTWSESEGDGEDFFQTLGDDPSLRGDLYGYQSNDVRHAVKVNATTITPWGIRLGTSVNWQSGYPYSILWRRFSRDALTPSFEDGDLGGRRGQIRDTYPTGARNDQRNPSFWNVDVKATKELNLGKRLNLQLSAEVFNLLDDGTYSVYNGEFGQQVNGNNDGQYRFGRRWQVGMKMAF